MVVRIASHADFEYCCVLASCSSSHIVKEYRERLDRLDDFFSGCCFGMVRGSCRLRCRGGTCASTLAIVVSGQLAAMVASGSGSTPRTDGRGRIDQQ